MNSSVFNVTGSGAIFNHNQLYLYNNTVNHDGYFVLNFNGENANVTSPVTVIITTSESIVQINETISIYVNLTDDMGNVIRNDRGVTVNINNETLTALFDEALNVHVLDYTSSVKGIFNVVAEFVNNTGDTWIAFTPVLTEIIISGDTVYDYGDLLDFIISISPSLNGSVNLTISSQDSSWSRNFTFDVVDGVVDYDLNTTLLPGLYEITISYPGSDYYYPSANSFSLIINKLASEVAITFDKDSYLYGDDVIITVTVGDATGEVNILVNGQRYTVDLVNGIGNITVSDLNIGRYEVTANYTGDSIYEESESSATFEILKHEISDVDVEITADDKDSIISVTLPEDATGNVVIYVDGVRYESEITDGSAQIRVEDVTKGNHYYTVYYSGDGKYDEYNGVLTAFAKDALTTDVDIEVNDNIATVTVNSTATGSVLLYVNGEIYSIGNISNGQATFDLSDVLTPGDYEIRAVYAGDDYFASANASDSVNIGKYSTNIAIDVDSVVFGNDVIIIVTANVTDATGNVTFSIGDETYTVNMNNGQATLTLDNLNAGSYTVTATYNGDVNYNTAENSADFEVYKASSSISIDVTDVSIVGSQVTIIATVPSGTGNVTFRVNGSVIGTANIVDGRATITYTPEVSGEFRVEATYNGDSNYNSSSVTETFTVSKITLDPELTINPGSTTEIIVGGLPEGLTDVIVNVDENRYTANYDNGNYVVSVDDLTSGLHNVTVTYNGNNVYDAFTVSDRFIISPIGVTIDINVDPSDLHVGDTVQVIATVTGVSEGNIVFTVNGRNYTIAINGGRAVLELDDLAAGYYSAIASFPGDSRHEAAASEVLSFEVSKYDISDIQVDITDNGKDSVITITNLPSDLTGSIIVNVDGNEENVQVNAGTATLTVEDVTTGTHYYSISYAGDDKYNAYNGALTAFDKDALTTDVGIEIGDNYQVTVTVNSTATGSVVLYINGNIYSAETISNGQAVFDLSDVLTPGNYEIEAVYSGDDFFAANSANDSVNVPKYSLDLTIDVDSVVFGDNVIIIATANVTDATGNVTFSIGDETYTANIVNGQATVTVEGLNAGSYDVTATYNGDVNYNTAENSADFEVYKASSSVIVDVENISTVGSQVTIIATVPSGTGTVTFRVNGSTIGTANIVDGRATITYTPEVYGEFRVEATYNGDSNYNSSSVSETFTVSKITLNPSLNITPGSNITTIVISDIPANLENIIVDVDGTDYYPVYANGSYVVTVGDLTMGLHNVTVTYDGNNVYDEFRLFDRFIVGESSVVIIDISLNVSTVHVGDAVQVIATVTGVSEGNITFNVNGRNYTVAINGGRAVLELSDLTAGYYYAIASFLGDSRHEAATSEMLTFEVLKYDISDVQVDITDNGKDSVITITNLPSDLTGSIVINVDGNEETVQVNAGTATLTVEDVTTGTHYYVVSYAGDDKYNAYSSALTAFDKDALTTDVGIEIDDNYQVTVTVNSTATGSIILYINGDVYTTETISNGQAVFDLSDVLTPGNYEIEAVYSGDSYFAANNNSDSVNVPKYNLDLTVDVDSVVFGDNVIIIAIFNATDVTGNVTFNVNDETYTANIINGQATVTVEGLNAGSYDVEVNYNGDVNYNSAENTGEFEVYKASSSVIVDVENISTVGNQVTIIATVPSGTGNVTFRVNGSVIGTVNIVDGRASITYTPNVSGEFRVEATYNGDSNYNASANSITFTVSKIATNPEITVNPGTTTTIDISGLPEGLENITVDIDGIKYPVSYDSDSYVASVDALVAGLHNLTVTYEGSAVYEGFNVSDRFVIDFISVTIDVDFNTTDLHVGDAIEVIATVTGLEEGNITFNINGETYNITIRDGQAVLVLRDLAAGYYSVLANYAGDAYHSSAASQFTSFEVLKYDISGIQVDITHNGKDSVITITNLPSDLTGSIVINVDGNEETVEVNAGTATLTVEDVTTGTHYYVVNYAGDDKYNEYNGALTSFTKDALTTDVDMEIGENYQVTVTVNSTATGSISIYINGAFYDIENIAGGVASFDLSDVLTPGNYEIEAVYSGDDFFATNNASDSVNVPKYNTDIVIDVDSIVFGDNVIIIARFNETGVTGNVTFNVANATYNANVINGEARVLVSGLNAGSYTVEVTYNGDVNYNTVENSAEFEVYKASSSVIIDVTDVSSVGNQVNIIATVPSGTGNVTFRVNGSVIGTVNIVDGRASITYTPNVSGEYRVEATYNGDSNYNASAADTTFTVSKIVLNPDLTVTPGSNTTIVISDIPADLENITVYVDNTRYEPVYANGSYVVTVEDLTLGLHNVTVTYAGDNVYDEFRLFDRFVIGETSQVIIDISTSPSILHVGDTVQIIAEVTGVEEGNITFTVNGETYTVAIDGGRAVLELDDLTAGYYSVIASFPGDSRHEAATSEIISFEVLKHDISGIHVDITDNGKDSVITITNLPSDLTGSIVINVDGNDETVQVIGGTATLTVEDVTAGRHYYLISYAGDDKYNAYNSALTPFVKDALTTDVDMEIGENYQVTVTVNSTATGSIILYINGDYYRAENIIGGVAGFDLSGVLTPGDYELEAVYSGDDFFATNNASDSVNVPKYNTNIAIDVDSIVFGDNVIIIARFNATDVTGNVTFNVATESYTANIINGEARITVEGLNAGSYNVNANYNGDVNYNSAQSSDRFEVYKASSSIIVTVTNVSTVGNQLTIIATVPYGTGSVTFRINNSDIGTRAIVNGTATITYTPATSGDFIVEAVYSGDVNYNSSTADATFTVSKITLDPTIDITPGATTIIAIGNLPVNLENITVDVDGTKYSATYNGTSYVATVGDLTMGLHNVTVTYNGTNVYDSFRLFDRFVVGETSDVVIDISINSSDLHVGDSVQIIADVTGVEEGNITFTVNGETYTVAIDGGRAVLELDDLTAGYYSVIASFPGDSRHEAASSDIVTFEVLKHDISDVQVIITPNGKDSVITITNLPSDLTGSVVINVDGVEQSVPVIGGTATLTVNEVTSGTHYYTVSYDGDDKYNNYYITLTPFNVDELDAAMDMNIDDSYMVIITVNSTATGSVDLYINNSYYASANISNGQARFDLSDVLTPGNHNISAVYSGDEFFASDNVEDSISVAKYPVDMIVNVDSVVFGDEVIIIAVLNSTSVTGNVTFTINGVNFTAEVINGEARLTLGSLNADSYTVDALYNGDNHFETAQSNATFNVYKASSSIAVDIENVSTVGSQVTIIATVPSGTGNVTFRVNGSVIGTVSIVDGRATITYTPATSGEFRVEATYNGDGNYNSSSISESFRVSKITLDPEVVITPGTTTVIEINDLPSGLTGITVTVDGNRYTPVYSEGSYVVEIDDLTAGSHDISVNYAGNNVYNGFSLSESFVVDPLITSITISSNASSINPTESVRVTVTVNTAATGNITIFINDVEGETVRVVNGVATFILSGLDEGEYTISAVYNGDDYYAPATSTDLTINVERIATDMSVDVTVSGNDATVVVRLPDDVTGSVSVVVDGITRTVAIVDGVARVTFDDLDVGDYTVRVTYNGDEKYAPATGSDSFEVTVIRSSINADDIILFYRNGTSLVMILTDVNGNPLANQTINIRLNSADYTRVTDSNGRASMAINLAPGQYSATITYNGNALYTSSSVTADITVLSTISGSDVVKYFRNGTQYYATFLDGEGRPLANTNVTFNINGVFYERQTNANGVARLNINLNPSEYIITATNPVNGQQYSNVITVLPTILGDDIVKYFRNATQYEVTVLDEHGRLAANQTVELNINGMIYYRETNSNGVARLSINLNPGEYIITATANGLSVSNSITVLPTLFGEDIVKYFRNGTQYYVSVLNGQGGPSVNTTVTFNINGVFYYRDTNESGIARLSINLNPGEYTVTATVNGLSVSNTVTVLPTMFAEDLEKDFGEPGSYNVTVVDDQGNPVVNQTVTMNINGVFYNRNTDENGIARLSINLNPGVYIITSEYDNYRISNTITVNQP